MKENMFTIHLNTDKNLISQEETTQRILEIRVQAPVSSQKEHRPNLNLALVLDRSGSMMGEKLEYVKKAAIHVLEQLKEQDCVALVVYDNEIQVLARSTKITHGNRFELKQLISGIRSGNMTNLRDGWLTGCKEVASSAQEGTINRTLLLTDGLANVGETDPELLAQHAFELYRDSIATSTFGVGEGFNEHLLEAMANQGGGNFYFIPKPDRIPDIFLKEFNDLVGITARKVEIKLDLPKSVEWKVLGGWSSEYKDGHLHIYLGDMLNGKLQDIYVKLQIPASEKSIDLKINTKVFGKDEGGNLLEEKAKVVFQSANQKEVDGSPLNQELMTRFSEVELADTATEALKLERKGEREQANRMLNENILRSRPYITPQAASVYQSRSDRMKNGMTEADRKQTHFDVYNLKRKKDIKEKE